MLSVLAPGLPSPDRHVVFVFLCSVVNGNYTRLMEHSGDGEFEILALILFVLSPSVCALKVCSQSKMRILNISIC